ncbi:MAG: OB-fold nucleic acid binding domain-containing protein [Nanoarchaeota archaeon]|nr:OB-fold nucleic acid binding domain-containing protein [Nanoarchaeota archaeon]
MEKEKDNTKKRAVAKIRKISSIKKEEDLRVSIIGTVVDIDSKSLFFTIDDGTDKVSVLLNNEAQLKDLKLGKIVRVIGLVMGFEDGFELRGEIVQDFNGLNIEYYNKFLDLSKV